jgi:uncharacterized membrane-anchored protein YjiN (DUF445 family)
MSERGGAPLTFKAARRLATGLLVAMAGLYAVAAALTPAYPGFSYVRAFAEAAMVGGLADWFAVTALFRRPLGLPIPHTAVIPNGKDRIAETLAHFIVSNFLAPDLVARRLEGVDLTAGLARQIADPATAARVADGVASAIPAAASAAAFAITPWPLPCPRITGLCGAASSSAPLRGTPFTASAGTPGHFS